MSVVELRSDLVKNPRQKLLQGNPSTLLSLWTRFLLAAQDARVGVISDYSQRYGLIRGGICLWYRIEVILDSAAQVTITDSWRG